MPRVALYTLGCKLNYAETSHIRQQFEELGYTVVPFGEPADVVLINTCTVTESADAECRKVIRRAHRLAPNAFIGVMGCYAQLKPEEIARIHGVSAVLGNQEKAQAAEIVDRLRLLGGGPHVLVSPLHSPCFSPARSADEDSRTRGFLKIQDGCSYRCSFCTIPKARGPSRSMPFSDLLTHFRALERAGYYEVVLTGINLGDYRAPTGERLIDVLRLLAELRPAFRVRLSSIEPNLLTPDILEIVASSPIFCPHFHIPLQSGSNEILRRMRRRYTVERYRSLILCIHERIPHCAIGVDVLTGFPGETEDHFAATYRLLEDLPISYIHAFTYSEREGTPAATMPGAVPVRVRRERTHRLRQLSELKCQHFYQANLGTTRTVIPEVYDPLTGTWEGWTENYIRVRFAAPPTLPQHPLPVRLTSLLNGVVWGELSEPSYIPIELVSGSCNTAAC
ncbi:MAG: tRNA (N(6)-L-threonylcarbamoyladenosine(37)-C(2))-methylthiotransferase MtaB [Candidatus Kapabacteria bacterium]|nr:tRNA (N(6)-L-threonylcarbamoyladenosine(37)-C(2))-methylthiotransferase MtaB [Candidatus Kapabacteria bacterium]MDW8011555.1 tRNA (N(6)-L-threonylcarbamoyladenosine(37)-C(2))-methylthiotransferase MtaB [Bacteroidota bacterium]